MLRYDSSVIYEFASRLYKQANGIIATYMIVGLLLGGATPYFALNRNATFTVAGAVVLAALGFLLGSQKAFALKLQAQTALCQVRIEENTRGVQGSSLPISASQSTVQG